MGSYFNQKIKSNEHQQNRIEPMTSHQNLHRTTLKYSKIVINQVISVHIQFASNRNLIRIGQKQIGTQVKSDQDLIRI